MKQLRRTKKCQWNFFSYLFKTNDQNISGCLREFFNIFFEKIIRKIGDIVKSILHENIQLRGELHERRQIVERNQETTENFKSPIQTAVRCI